MESRVGVGRCRVRNGPGWRRQGDLLAHAAPPPRRRVEADRRKPKSARLRRDCSLRDGGRPREGGGAGRRADAHVGRQLPRRRAVGLQSRTRRPLLRLDRPESHRVRRARSGQPRLRLRTRGPCELHRGLRSRRALPLREPRCRAGAVARGARGRGTHRAVDAARDRGPSCGRGRRDHHPASVHLQSRRRHRGSGRAGSRAGADRRPARRGREDHRAHQPPAERQRGSCADPDASRCGHRDRRGRRRPACEPRDCAASRRHFGRAVPDPRKRC